MDGARWQRVKALFLAAVERPAEERRAFLERECGGDAELVREVEEVLASDAASAGFLEPPRALTGPVPASGLAAGRSFDGLEIREELGRGGMGVVYRARDLALERDVAVKVLLGALALDTETADRFQREARRAARLVHPHVVAVHRVGALDGCPYFVMDLVEGHDVAREIEAQTELRAGRSPARTPLLPAYGRDGYLGRCAALVADVADALDAAHQRGIVHRDIKPHNLLLGVDGRVFLVDFGLARDTALGRVASRPGALVGTVHYMSPEQARAHSQKVDHRTDVYSLGVVLYELLTLRRPFTGTSELDVLRHILDDEPPAPRRLQPRIPRDLEAVCLAAMAKEPAQRYASAAAFRDDLRRFLAHEAVHAVRRKPLHAALAFARRRRRPLAAAALALAGMFVAAWLQAWSAERTRRAEWRVELGSVANAVDWVLLASGGDAPGGERDVARLLALLAALDGDDASRPARDAARARLDELRGVLLARGAQARTAASNPDNPGAAGWWALEGERAFARVRRLFPGEPGAEPLPATTLAVRHGPDVPDDASASLHLARIDPATGQPGQAVLVGRSPHVDGSLLPGPYRILADFGGGRRVEATRWIEFGRHVEVLLPWPPAGDDASAGMVAIGGGDVTVALFPGLLPCEGETVRIEPYWIDAAEVSNGEYARFLAATARPEPALWSRIGPARRPPHWDELPVVDIAVEDMQAYAEWSGKRLPTVLEWWLAATGGERGLVPWRDARTPAEVGANTALALPTPYGTEELDAAYASAARPVRSAADACTPDGIHHLHGNVWEVTESFIPQPDGAGWTTSPDALFALGGHWNLDARFPFPAVERTSFDRREGRRDWGFRCARSILPSDRP